MWTRSSFVIGAGIGAYDESEEESDRDRSDDEEDHEANRNKAKERPPGYDIWIASYQKLMKIYPDLKKDLTSKEKKYASKSKIEVLVSDYRWTHSVLMWHRTPPAPARNQEHSASGH